MQGIKWQDNGFFDENDELPATSTSNEQVKMSEENVDKRAMQLKKFQDPSKDTYRQSLLSLVDMFAALLVKGDIAEIATNLLTEESETFVFNLTGRIPVQHSTGLQEFTILYKSMKIVERQVRITNVDSEKGAVCQICKYKLVYDDNDHVVEEEACEIFNIKDYRISKYRICFGQSSQGVAEYERFLEPTRKDKMLAQVKRINYALADQPDLEKVASLFDEHTEYKIWRWDDYRCITLNKSDFASSFRSLEDNMFIKSVVPYELSTDPEGKIVIGTYVYHLEERSSGQQFVWLSTCIYGFDHNIRLSKISQQGELHIEEESIIPFEAHSRESLLKRVTEFFKSFDNEYDAFFNDIALYDCSFYGFTPLDMPNPGFFQGIKHIDKIGPIMEEAFKDIKLNDASLVDVFYDFHDESHDVIFAFDSMQGADFNNNSEEPFHLIGFAMLSLENGKIAKELDFNIDLKDPISSPFDDKNFSGWNIKSK